MGRCHFVCQIAAKIATLLLGQVRREIIGIDPEAGIMKKTREAMQVYGLGRYRLLDGGEVSMTAELSNAIRGQKWGGW